MKKGSIYILLLLRLFVSDVMAQCTPDATISPAGPVNICAGNSVTLTAPPGNVWTKMTDLTGLERQNAVGFSVGTKGYIGTGRNASATSYSDFWEYDPANDSWTQKADFGGGVRWGAVGFGIGTKGYVGTGRNGAVTYTDFWEYNPATNIWTAKTAFTGSSRYFAVGFSIGTKGYIGTGWDGTTRFTDFREYDPGTNTWTNRAAFTGASRHSAVGFAVGTKGYIGTGSVSTVLNETDFYEYNPATNAWAAKADFPAAGRYGATGFGIGSKGFLGTGFDGTSYYNDFYEYNVLLNFWTARANYGAPACRYAVGFSIDDKGYIGTGLNGTTLYKQFWEYYPACTYSWSSGQTTQSISASTAGSYTVTVNAVTGCNATSEPTIVTQSVINPIIDPAGSINICSGVDTVLTASANEDVWVVKADFGGTARSGAVGFSIGLKGYIGTGFDGNWKDDFWEYDPATNAWMQKANFGGTARSGAVGFSIGSKGYIGTGIVSGPVFKNDFWEYNPVTNTWVQKANFGGTARSGAVGFSIGSKGYIGTGSDGTRRKDFWEYDPITNTWALKANFGGTARSGAVGFSLGSKGYIGTGNDAAFRKDFWEYDPATNTWTPKADFGGTARQTAIAFYIGSKGYIGTGWDGANNRDFWEYEPTTNAWTQMATFGGTEREQAVGFSIGDKGYVGTGNKNILFNKDFWQYNPEYTYSWSSGQTTQSITASTAGSYTVTVTDGYGCNATSAATVINVLPSPTAVINPAGTVNICQGNSTTLTATDAGNIWTQKADVSNLGRIQAVGFSISSKGYIGTGVVAGVKKNDFWEYDPNTNTWTQKANFIGTARALAVGFSIGMKGYIGTGDDGIKKNDFWEYDPNTNTWTQKANFGGTARLSAVGFSIGIKGYIGTGFDAGNRNDFLEYDPSYTYSWSSAETTQSITTSTAGSYTVTVTDGYGCSATSAATVISYDNSPLNGVYTISTAPASCTNYISFQSAINDLNNRSISGNVRFNVAAGFTETVPVGGLALGTQKLNDSTATGKTITFIKSGVGANPLLTAYAGGTATPASAAPDGIFSLRGVDNVTIDQIDLIDNNASNPATMEYGYGLFKRNNNDGVQGVTIIRCNITLNRINNAAGAGVMPAGSTGILSNNSTATAAITALTPTNISGSNSYNKFYANIISNCNNGIGLFGPLSNNDGLNDIGGTDPSAGNQILNFGGAAGATNIAVGIWLVNQFRPNVSFNTLNSNNGSGANHPSTLRGIYVPELILSGSTPATINNNNITLKGAGTTQPIWGIDIGNSSGIPSNTIISINNNNITESNNNATTGSFIGIQNTCLSQSINIIGNTIQNCSHSGTGEWNGIYNQADNYSININNNFVINNTISGSSIGNKNSFIGTLRTGSTYASPIVNLNGNTISGNIMVVFNGSLNSYNFLSSLSQVVGFGLASISNNTISNNIALLKSSTTQFQLSCITKSLQSSHTISGNILYNNGVIIDAASLGAAITLSGVTWGLGNLFTSDTANNNQIRNLYIKNGTGSSTALNFINGFYSNVTGTNIKVVSNNLIDSLFAGSNISSVISGIRDVSLGTINIIRNTINRLYPGHGAAAGSYAAGIRTASGTTVNIHHNMIGLDYTGSSAEGIITNPDGLKGIEVASTTGTSNIYFNSIHLKGSGGTGFGSSGIGFTATGTPTHTFLLRNNIIDNQSTPNGAGKSVALRRATTAAGQYANISANNHNSFYAGTAGPNNLLYSDGTNDCQTLTSFNTVVSDKEQFSISGTTAFVAPPLNLHLDPANNCDKESGALPIAGITQDYDSTARDINYPDIGADEFDPTGPGLTTWKGLNANWNDVKNWCGTLPSATSSITIPGGKNFYPVITAAGPLVKDISISSGASVTISGSGHLAIFGSVSNAGTFNTTDGTIEMAGSSTQTIPANSFQNNDLKNLVINNDSVQLDGPLNLYGRLSFTGNNRKLVSAGNLVLKSTASGTAEVTDMTNNGANNNNHISGDVTVERFINTGTGVGQHPKSWQFLATPTNGQSIREAWQENGATPAGFGTIITGTGTGFDIATTSPSIKTYNASSNNWTAVTNTNNALLNKSGYMLFVRGDRTVTTSSASPNITNMRSKGALFTPLNPAPAVSVGVNQFQSVGNPYASRIEFSKVRALSSGMTDVFYVWDPKLYGGYGYGGYQTLSGVAGYVPAAGSPTTIYPAGVASPYIESGQAVFMRAGASGGTVNFAETVKQSGNRLVNRERSLQHILDQRSFIFTSLFTGGLIADGHITAFESGLGNELNENDAPKLLNAGENLGSKTSDSLLAVEARNSISDKDSIQFSIRNMRQQAYQFCFAPIRIPAQVNAFLKDRFLQTETPVSMTDSSWVSFNITTDPASSAENRFCLVFRLSTLVPVKFISVSAKRSADRSVLVGWSVANESGILLYEVESSVDGIHFVKAGGTQPKNNQGGNALYRFMDQAATPGNVYYRILAKDLDGTRLYSTVVLVRDIKEDVLFSIYPNPVTDGRIRIVLSENAEGLFGILLTDADGRTIARQRLDIHGAQTVVINRQGTLAKGVYQLKVTLPDGNEQAENVLVE